ncbi:MAG: GntR family transcriptional regulator [Lachnospiraceae bacterium]|nr:GntR family transcriptional regulator [Lachnospiraceae bacterium]
MANDEKSQVIKAYETIKHDICIRAFQPGSPIVNKELYKRLGMSRTPVREAIRLLEMEGLVENIPKKGPYVKVFTKEELLLCYEVLDGLDGMLSYNLATRFANKDITLEETSVLHEYMDGMDQCLLKKDNLKWVQFDNSFHQALKNLSNNSILIDSINRFEVQFHYVSINYILPYDDWSLSNDEHREIVRYIEAGDPANARIATQNQKKRIRDLLKMSTTIL